MATSNKIADGTNPDGYLNKAMPLLQVFASLRLTVVLFFLSIILIFLGTLAQVDQTVWEVINETYFRVWIAKINCLPFLRLIEMADKERFGLSNDTIDAAKSVTLWFPGGFTLGLLLLINLFTAHVIHFRMNARGPRFFVGLVVLLAGLATTVIVISSGANITGEANLSPRFNVNLWIACKAALMWSSFGGIFLLVTAERKKSPLAWNVLAGIVLCMGSLTAYLYYHYDFQLDDAGLRIIWQLVKGSGAGIICGIGCFLIFRKRAGIVLLHIGVAMLLLSEAWTAFTANEAQMTLAEGQTLNYALDIRESELAIIQYSSEKPNRVSVISESSLALNAPKNQDPKTKVDPRKSAIHHKFLPFDVRVLKYYKNGFVVLNTELPLQDRKNVPQDYKLQELAKVFGAVESRSAVGTDREATVNTPVVYVQLLDKKTGDSLGVYLAFISLKDKSQLFEYQGEKYGIALRFKRIYKPYTITLNDFTSERYQGTNRPKAFVSTVQLKQKRNEKGKLVNIDRRVTISMNNPLRYSGDTLYQQSYNESAAGTTSTLQVVKNEAWLAPYVSCMFVCIGMLFHFSQVLQSFLKKEATSQQKKRSQGEQKPTRLLPIITLTVLSLMIGMLARSAARLDNKENELHIQKFGDLPVLFEGRFKPVDTLARITLQFLGARQSAKLAPDPDRPKNAPDPKSISATKWLLTVAADPNEAQDYAVFKIPHFGVLTTLGLKRRSGYMYAYNEFKPKLNELQKEIKRIQLSGDKNLSKYDQKIKEIMQKLLYYKMITESLAVPTISDKGSSELAAENIVDVLAAASSTNGRSLPLFIPAANPLDPWKTLPEANLARWFKHARTHDDQIAELFGNMLQYFNQSSTPAEHAEIAFATNEESKNEQYKPEMAARYERLFAAYRRNNAEEFNTELDLLYKDLKISETKLQTVIKKSPQLIEHRKSAEIYDQTRGAFEAFYNRFSPAWYASWLYLLPFLFITLSWLFTSVRLSRIAFWLMVGIFGLHTYALAARVYISGRPPITNLYSSAVFIGWGLVLFSIFLGAVLKFRSSSVIGSITGFTTLLIAYMLSLDGDTMKTLQPVLDTQFWLTTHVICITLGYSTTFLAGAIGLYYVMHGLVKPYTKDEQRDLEKMIYGAICFATFFSFVGTVLGGLWADDSWGRFWGWDTKENGAVLIVLWNAIILHARWGRMVRARGLAALAIFGNIITAWAWFGVNQLGIGLHSYGFNSSLTQLLLLFVSSQLLILFLALFVDKKPAKAESIKG